MIDQSRIVTDMRDAETVRRLATTLRRDGSIARAVAEDTIPQLSDLSLQTIEFAAHEQGAVAFTVSETANTDETSRLHVDATGSDPEDVSRHVTEIAQEGMDVRDLWSNLVEWAPSNVAIWTADELQEEYGPICPIALSDDEL